MNEKGAYRPEYEIKILSKSYAMEDEQYWRTNCLDLIQMIECVDTKVKENKRSLGKGPLSEL